MSAKLSAAKVFWPDVAVCQERVLYHIFKILSFQAQR